MSFLIPERDLPLEISPFQAVEIAYAGPLARCEQALHRHLPVLIECDKELVPYLYKCLRDRLKKRGMRCTYLDGRPRTQDGPQGLLPNLLTAVRDTVRSAVDDRVVVLPHLDLLTTSTGTLTSEAREVTGLLYEDPKLLWVGFKDPNFQLPQVIANLFPHHETIQGVERDKLPQLVTQREARKFGDGLPVYTLYKYASGLNAVRLRRLLSSIDGEDYPAVPDEALAQLRQSTLGNSMSMPTLSLTDDIGGYSSVKQRLQREILQLLTHKEGLTDPAQIERIETLVPRGMIFWGPPGTGKTMFAKAMAASLGAAVIIVSGPELKSKWHGESEQNIRRVFNQARQSAPAIIVFDELDSIASSRGNESSDGGVSHSMVNQLLTELDGFRSNEMVFVVGTTNFPESLDPALLRPGRFEFSLQIPYPNAEDRREILAIYNRKFELDFTEPGLDYAVKRTSGPVVGAAGRYTGDHLQALCRGIARRRIREQLTTPTCPPDIDETLDEFADRPKLTAAERRVVATHEAGHAVVALHCTHLPPIDRISIRGDLGGALGYVSYGDSANQYVQTRHEILDRIAVLFGGREAEALLLNDMSFGSANDLAQATQIARYLTADLAMDQEELGIRCLPQGAPISEHAQVALERRVDAVLAEQRGRAKMLVQLHQDEVLALTELLLENEVLDRSMFTHMEPSNA